MTSPQSAAQRARSRYRQLDVRSADRITPRVVRVVLGGAELADFTSTGNDQRIKLCLPRPGQPTPRGRDRGEVFALPREQQPKQRTYTVRRFDPDRLELTVDLVLHEHEAPGSAWAARVRPGEQIVTVGPSPSYQPDPDADRLVLAGDETALPAIAAIAEQLPAGAKASAHVEIADEHEQQEISSAADVAWHWIHRGDRAAGEPLVEHLRQADLGPRPSLWIGAEAAAVRELRDHFAALGRDRLHALAYWRRDRAG